MPLSPDGRREFFLRKPERATQRLAHGTRFMRANSLSVSGRAAGDPFGREGIMAGDSCLFEAPPVVGHLVVVRRGMRYAPLPGGSLGRAGGFPSSGTTGCYRSRWPSRRRDLERPDASELNPAEREAARQHGGEITRR